MLIDTAAAPVTRTVTRPLVERLKIIRSARQWLAEHALEVSATIPRPKAETLASELLPLLEACRFLERNAERILASKMLDDFGQPIWLRGVGLELVREPVGVVLIIGPGNYPLMLPGIHVMQALAAGNRVILKPGIGGTAPARVLQQALRFDGLEVLGESPEEAQDAIRGGVDKIVVTGSTETGKAVARTAAEAGIPAIMELSGDDPVFVLPDADQQLVLKALRFGTSLNGGNTCIAPRRIYLYRERAGTLEHSLRSEFPSIPLHLVSTDDEALQLAGRSEYALGATVFGGEEHASSLARRIRAGVVVINDMIVPTADPRLPFGGSGKSGFGVTRGEEGLLELTRVKAIVTRRSKWLPHLQPPHPSNEKFLQGMIAGKHGRSWRSRITGWNRAAGAILARRKDTSS